MKVKRVKRQMAMAMPMPLAAQPSGTKMLAAETEAKTERRGTPRSSPVLGSMFESRCLHLEMGQGPIARDPL